MFIEKFKTTQKGLYNFFLERLELVDIENISTEITEELKEFKNNKKDFNIQLANRLTLIEFFKYIFIRTYEDFQLIHKKEDNIIVPVTFGKELENIKYFSIDEFNERYIKEINKVGFKDIGEQFFQGFSSLFRKYEIFIEEVILEGDTIEEEFDKEYYSRLFDIIYFLNEFYFGGLESEGDDIIGRLYETSLERADRKKFGQFYTPRYVIDFILEELAVNPAENIKIADLSCGTGGFLMKYLSKIKGNILMKDNNSAIRNIFRQTYGIDIKIFSILLTKLNLALIFIIKNKYLLEKNFQSHKLDTKNIITGDGLEINTREDLKLENGTFDYIVGNPPYVGIKGNSDIFQPIMNDKFYGNFMTKKADLYYFFVIAGIEKLKVGGKLGYIFPREWMTADYANKLREYILKNTKILKIIDLDGISIFEDAGTSSLILFLEKIDINNSNEEYIKSIKEHSLEYIEFKKFKDKNIIKYIDEISEELQTKTTDNKKQTVLTGFETFSQKILNSKNFDRIIDSIKNKRDFDISYLGGFTTGKLLLNNFINIKNIKQNTLTDKPWIFGYQIIENNILVPLNDILKTSQGIVTGADRVLEKHIEKGLAKNNQIGRGIFILKENIDIRGIGLRDIGNNKENFIGKIEINLYENGGWTELNNEEKSLIKNLYMGKELNKWNIKQDINLFIIYNNPADESKIDSVKNYKGNNYDEDIYIKKYPNIYKHFLNYTNILKSRRGSGNIPYIKKGHFVNIDTFKGNVNFEKEKIVLPSRDLYFTYTEKSFYSGGGTNYILFNTEDNLFTLELLKHTNKKDYLKFINSILNSKTIINYFKENKFNLLSCAKLNELKIPKIDFNNEEQKTKYFKIVDLSNQLIELYNKEENKFDIYNLKITKNGKDNIVEYNSIEFNNLLNSYDFKVVDDILFYIIIGENKYFGFDYFKDKLIKEENSGKNYFRNIKFGRR